LHGCFFRTFFSTHSFYPPTLTLPPLNAPTMSYETTDPEVTSRARSLVPPLRGSFLNLFPFCTECNRRWISSQVVNASVWKVHLTYWCFAPPVLHHPISLFPFKRQSTWAFLSAFGPFPRHRSFRLEPQNNPPPGPFPAFLPTDSGTTVDARRQNTFSNFRLLNYAIYGLGPIPPTSKLLKCYLPPPPCTFSRLSPKVPDRVHSPLLFYSFCSRECCFTLGGPRVPLWPVNHFFRQYIERTAPQLGFSTRHEQPPGFLEASPLSVSSPPTPSSQA